MTHNKFGGKWTDEKLQVLSEYLIGYLKILKKTNFDTWYIDGFAGTGMIEKKIDDPLPLFDQEDIQFITQYRKGSVTKALELENPFDHYLFIEKDPDCYGELQKTVSQYQNLKIETKCGDANNEITKWIDRVNHKSTRAVLFLDPYGMAVDWITMEKIAKSKIIDTWILFPLGSGVNRMLKNDGDIPLSWQNKLDKFFGSHDWYDHFYKEPVQASFFSNNKKMKVVNEEEIGYYFYKRLSSIFCKVASSCGNLQNEKGSNLFLFFFAASNDRGASPAINISSYLINKRFSNVYSFENRMD
jgi:three-Cys-motif partner protein